MWNLLSYFIAIEDDGLYDIVENKQAVDSGNYKFLRAIVF